jgi:curved DNA-binding protein CbpA
MDYKKALQILEININEFECELSIFNIKKQYHKLALLNHPDKNNGTSESTQKFLEIKTAYDCLMEEMFDDSIDSDDSIEFSETNSTVYFTILNLFIKTMFNNPLKDNTSIYEIINNIISNTKKITVKLFDKLDKETLIDIYLFLTKYKSVLHLKTSILEEIKEIIQQKYKNVEIYELNPSINDLLNNNLYKLYVNEKLYLVPLWRRENYFDCYNNEIIAICEPELPDNIKIDDKNNIYTQFEILISNLNQIIEETFINIPIGNVLYQVPVSHLNIMREQYYTFKKKGLTKENSDLDNISNKADIIIKIKLI